MFRVGPAGNADSFYAQGHTASLEAPAWLHALGLTAYEYSFGHGVALREETALALRAEAEKYGISVSVHAPYYINFANPAPEKRAASLDYVLRSAQRARWLGGNRVVVHTGAQQKYSREEALARCREGLLEALEILEQNGLNDIRLCPETMGRPGQIGDLQEVLYLCRADERLIPCVDFAHLHALSQGALRDRAAFARVLDQAENALGRERARRMHIHFSAIEFTQKGEKRHRTFSEEAFGPRFCHLAPELVQRDYAPVIICESRGTQAEDAVKMLAMLETAKTQNN